MLRFRDLARDLRDFANYLRPIETPLVFNGFSEQAIQLFSKQFASAGIVPVMGAGSVSDDKQPEPLEAGLGGQRDSGARRYGYRGHVHGHLHRSAAACWLADIRCCSLARSICR